MIVGWLEDPAAQIGYRGGAELDSEAVRSATKHEIVMMGPGEVAAGADVYVIANCVYFRPKDMQPIDGPIVRVCNDSWRGGDRAVSAWIADHANVFLVRSPLHRERLAGVFNGHRVELVPSHVELERFREAAGRVEKQERALFLANVLSPQRRDGLRAARHWADAKGLELDAYGIGTPGGVVPYDEVPDLFASHRWYAHAMGRGDYEPFGRATVEAWAAGCNLAVGDDTGALWWIRERPEDLERGAEIFWEAVESECR